MIYDHPEIIVNLSGKYYGINLEYLFQYGAIDFQLILESTDEISGSASFFEGCVETNPYISERGLCYNILVIQKNAFPEDAIVDYIHIPIEVDFPFDILSRKILPPKLISQLKILNKIFENSDKEIKDSPFKSQKEFLEKTGQNYIQIYDDMHHIGRIILNLLETELHSLFEIDSTESLVSPNIGLITDHTIYTTLIKDFFRFKFKLIIYLPTMQQKNPNFSFKLYFDDEDFVKKARYRIQKYYKSRNSKKNRISSNPTKIKEKPPKHSRLQ